MRLRRGPRALARKVTRDRVTAHGQGRPLRHHQRLRRRVSDQLRRLRRLLRRVLGLAARLGPSSRSLTGLLDASRRGCASRAAGQATIYRRIQHPASAPKLSPSSASTQPSGEAGNDLCPGHVTPPRLFVPAPASRDRLRPGEHVCPPFGFGEAGQWRSWGYGPYLPKPKCWCLRAGLDRPFYSLDRAGPSRTAELGGTVATSWSCGDALRRRVNDRV